MRPQTSAERPFDIAVRRQGLGRGGQRGGQRSEKSASSNHIILIPESWSRIVYGSFRVIDTISQARGAVWWWIAGTPVSISGDAGPALANARIPESRYHLR